MAIKRPVIASLVLALVVAFCAIPASAVYEYGGTVYVSELDCFEFLDGITSDDRSYLFSEYGVPDGYAEYRAELLAQQEVEEEPVPYDPAPVIDDVSEPDVATAAEPDSEPDVEPELVQDDSDAPVDVEIENPDGTTEMLTVNISEESISAIAQAVAATTNIYASDYEIEPGVYIPSAVFDYPYFVIFSNPTRDYWSCIGSTEPITVSESRIDADAYEYYCYTANVFVSIEGREWITNTGYDFQCSFAVNGGFCYSSFDIVDDATGETVHVSDFKDPVISFDTGDTGLIIDSQLASSFSLPNVSAPGYSFAGWYLDPEYTVLYTSGYEFTDDTTLYAKFEEVPPMAVVHQSIFGALGAFLQSTPMTYILSIFGIIVFIAICKKIIVPRL